MSDELGPIPKRLADSLAAEPLTREVAERLARCARAYIDAALANKDVQSYIRDLNPWHKMNVWTVAKVRENPPVCVEFEGGFVFGGIGESINYGSKKPSFGKLVCVGPLLPDDPVGELHILAAWKNDNPRQLRFAQRKRLKKRLAKRGKGFRALVGEAMRHTQTEFLKRFENPVNVDAVRRALGVDLRQFWRAVRGKVFLDLPKLSTQLDLFEGEPDAA